MGAYLGAGSWLYRPPFGRRCSWAPSVPVTRGEAHAAGYNRCVEELLLLNQATTKNEEPQLRLVAQRPSSPPSQPAHYLYAPAAQNSCLDMPISSGWKEKMFCLKEVEVRAPAGTMPPDQPQDQRTPGPGVSFVGERLRSSSRPGITTTPKTPACDRFRAPAWKQVLPSRRASGISGEGYGPSMESAEGARPVRESSIAHWTGASATGLFDGTRSSTRGHRQASAALGSEVKMGNLW